MVVRPIDGNDFMRRLTLDTSKGHYGEFTDGSEVAFTSREIAAFVEQMPTLTPQNEPARAGLYGKYTVRKNSDGSLVTDCFVLRPNKDLAAVAALRAYAAATDNAELAVDIINWVGADPNEPLTLEQLREMDGKPAYIPETNCWVLVTKNPFVPLFTWPDGEQCSAYDWYEQVGPVYRRPPEGEEGDADRG